MAKKSKKVFECSNCGFQTAKWMGRCTDCGEWNSFTEQTFSPVQESIKVKAVGETQPKKLKEIEVETYNRVSTGIDEFDRVVGGGLVPGSLILIGGEPGIGKSTLLTEMLSKLSGRQENESFLYVSGEESEGQVAGRAKRMGLKNDSFYIYNETNWQNILNQIKKIKPRFMVLDSIQTTTSSELSSPPGTVSQIREVTYELMNHVKATGITCFVVGHITKDGAIAGPKILEHMVDTVIYFEGDQFGHYRMLRAIKNRFGNTNEVGIFEMKEDGLNEVKNPSQFFLEDDLEGSFGKSLTCIKEGTRPLFVEVQALVAENKFGNGRRTTQGLDNNRVAMMVAIIEKYASIPMGMNDIYVNVVGSMKLTTRESDLSIIAALLSSYKSKPIPKDTIFLGEVGLTGEVRTVPHMEMRIKEMESLNYKTLVASPKIAREFSKKSKLKIIPVRKITDIFSVLGD
ncbi:MULTISPECIES: DNA repair protein RadA [Halobacteriovorax]|uniref:DNA repair protein RadA n=2 Tax=Halobacteriovorax TaxID=1652133 RepID=A0ABY0IPC2_9BACT|nr:MULTISPECIES: DNA repair protein RadA [Halobacteriovorax]AYF46006.1 DNA repair protein RadA [Halobacteriovorax sp. BALOs_7]RZF23032.1 DNA repair protein RadA [Halobacteriovorax vibrionivorans]